MSELKRTKQINIKGDTFTLDIENLTIANLIAIETEKQRLTSGKYFSLAQTMFVNTQNALSLVDMISIFRVLLPKIEKSLNGISYEELNIINSKELLSVYIKDVSDWYTGWLNEFSSPFKEDEE